MLIGFDSGSYTIRIKRIEEEEEEEGLWSEVEVGEDERRELRRKEWK